MAAAVFTRSPAPYLNRLENFESRALLGIGLGNSFDVTDAERALGHTPGSACAQALNMALKGYHELEYAMSADTVTAGVINLTTGALVDFLTVGGSRRVEFQAYLKADVDNGAIQADYTVACAATPIVGLITVMADNDVLPGDLAAATAAITVSTADVILTLTGITDIDTRWVVKVRIFPRITLPLIATT